MRLRRQCRAALETRAEQLVLFLSGVYYGSDYPFANASLHLLAEPVHYPHTWMRILRRSAELSQA